jgi:hypothetical protein
MRLHSVASRPACALVTALALASCQAVAASQTKASQTDKTPPASAQTQATPEHFTALAVNSNGPVGAPASTTVDIDIERWSTDAESDHLLTVLAEQGPDKLLTTLESLPRAGSFRTPDSVGYDIHFARRTRAADGSDRITLVTDRNIGYWERANAGRSTDYPFTVIELRIRKDGSGEGKMSIATKITTDPATKSLVLENYNASPVMLTTVRRLS